MREHTVDRSRRRFLAAAGTVGSAAAAGCLGVTDDEGDAGAASEEHHLEAGFGTNNPLTASPEQIDLEERGNEVTLSVVDARHQIVADESDGGPLELPEVWAWQADDGDPSVPGPLLRVSEGETVEIEVDNSAGNHPHTIHVHAQSTSWRDEGAPTTSGVDVTMGQRRTYELEADVPGTHPYHCHVDTPDHVDMGMYGIFRVDPEEYEPPDREYFLPFREWDSRLHYDQAGADVDYAVSDRDPDLFTIGGRSAPTALHPELGRPVVVSEGETVRLHLVNFGFENHTMHTHKHRFRVVEQDGTPIEPTNQRELDVVDVGAAQRYTIEFEADAEPGIYPLHCHRADHATNLDDYPGGMHTAIIYESARDSRQYERLQRMAGSE